MGTACSESELWRAQAFLTLSYRQPPLRAVKPSQTRLVIAPIDAVYSQAVLLHVTAFLNAAWPPPALDPLTVRTTVTLREIVTERLVGRKRPHQLQKHQQALQQLQARASNSSAPHRHSMPFCANPAPRRLICLLSGFCPAVLSTIGPAALGGARGPVGESIEACRAMPLFCCVAEKPVPT